MTPYCFSVQIGGSMNKGKSTWPLIGWVILTLTLSFVLSIEFHRRNDDFVLSILVGSAIGVISSWYVVGLAHLVIRKLKR